MPKLKPKDLENLAQEERKKIYLREGAGKVKIIVHMGTCGIAAGAREIMSVLISELMPEDTKGIIVTTSGCAGLCSHEPMATVELKGKPPVKYVDLTKEKMRKIFNEHVLKGKIVSEYALAVGSERSA